ncbi:MAG: hypothetical protein ABIE23_06225 [archaeon]
MENSEKQQKKKLFGLIKELNEMTAKKEEKKKGIMDFISRIFPFPEKRKKQKEEKREIAIEKEFEERGLKEIENEILKKEKEFKELAKKHEVREKELFKKKMAELERITESIRLSRMMNEVEEKKETERKIEEVVREIKKKVKRGKNKEKEKSLKVKRKKRIVKVRKKRKARRRKKIEEEDEDETPERREIGKRVVIKTRGGVTIMKGRPSRAGAVGAAPAEAPAKTQQERDVDLEIEKMKERIKNLRMAYFKREVTEQEYRQKMYDYKEELHLLEVENKRIGERKKEEEKRKAAEPAKEEVRERVPEREGVETPRREMSEDDSRRLKALDTFRKEFTAGPSSAPSTTVSPEPKEFDLGKFERKAPEDEKEGTEIEKKISQIIEKKGVVGKVGETRLKKMEKKAEKLMSKYHIPEEEMEEAISKLGTKKLLADFDKLINLMELEHKTHELVEVVKPEKEKSYIGSARPAVKEEVKGVIRDIRKYRIITAFDKILSLVNQKGIAREKELVRELGMKKERVMECCEILKENGLLKIEYPPIGDTKIISKNYVPKKEKKKEKKK